LPTFADDDEKVSALISQSGDEELDLDDEDDDLDLPDSAQVQSVETISTSGNSSNNVSHIYLFNHFC